MSSKPRKRMSRRVTMVEIAAECGVSQAAVSYILNNNWRENGIAESTRDRVVETARKLHYRPNGIARRLLAGRTNLIGLVLPNLAASSGFFSQITFALEVEASERQYHVILAHSHNRRDREEREIGLLLDLCVDGLIVAPAFDEPPGRIYKELEGHPVPLVFLDSSLDGITGNVVATDDIAGGRMATEHLIGLGHRRIAHLAGPQTASSTRGRCEGYRKALAEAGLSKAPELVAELGMRDYESAARIVRQWLRKHPDLTAVSAASDQLAAGALYAVRELGKRVPEDVSIIGYGDIPIVSNSGIRIDTVRQPTREMGRLAAELLIDTVERKVTGTERRYLRPELVLRATCASPQAARETAVAGRQKEARMPKSTRS